MQIKFQSFHPYLTYKSDGKYFIQPNGTPSFEGWSSICKPTEMNDDALDLWRLGKRAFDAFGEFPSRAEFDDCYQYYLKTIKDIKRAIADHVITDPNYIVFVNMDGEKRDPPDFDNISNSGVIEIAWQATREQSGDTAYVRGLFLFACLEEIDNSIIGMCLDGRYAVSGALAAAEAYANYQAIETGNDNLQKVRSEIAAHAAIERYKRDPKQTAKAFIKECWGQWQNNPTHYEKQSSFANDMLTKVPTDANGNPIISFDTVVKKWIPAWTKNKK